MALLQRCMRGTRRLALFIRLKTRCLKKVADFDCSSLIEGCEMLLNIAASNQKAGVPSKDYANKAPAAAASSSSSAAGPSSGSG